MRLFGNRLFGGNFFDGSFFDRGGSLVGRGLLFGSLSLGDRLLLLRSLGERLFGHNFFDGGSLFDSFGDLFDSLFGVSFFDSGLFGSLLDGSLFGSRGRSLFGDGFVCNDGSNGDDAVIGSSSVDSNSGLVRSGNFFLLGEQLVVHDDELLHQEHDQEVGDGIGDDGHHACPAFGHADTDPEVLNGGSNERLGDDQRNTHDHIDRKAESQIVDSGKSLLAVENVRDDLGDNIRDQIRDESCKRQRVNPDRDKRINGYFFAIDYLHSIVDAAQSKQIVA